MPLSLSILLSEEVPQGICKQDGAYLCMYTAISATRPADVPEGDESNNVCCVDRNDTAHLVLMSTYLGYVYAVYVIRSELAEDG